MAETWIFTQTLRIGNNSYATAVTKTSDGAYTYDSAVAANQTDKLVACNIDVSQVVGIYISSDQDCTIETNSNNASGGQTINIDADNPYVWVKDSGITNPLTTDITALYITNTTAITRLQIRILVDLTV